MCLRSLKKWARAIAVGDRDRAAAARAARWLRKARLRARDRPKSARRAPPWPPEEDSRPAANSDTWDNPAGNPGPSARTDNLHSVVPRADSRCIGARPVTRRSCSRPASLRRAAAESACKTTTPSLAATAHARGERRESC